MTGPMGDAMIVGAPAFRIGRWDIPAPAVLAPMAGVTDRPFRIVARGLGAALAASEMITSDTRLWNSRKSRMRMDHTGEPEPRVVQLAGAEPEAIAEAARRNVDLGAQIIDINMGCPAKKVCAVAAGSALMGQEKLALDIIDAVVQALANRREPIPVTVKMRTGICDSKLNAPHLALAMEALGVSMIVVHGRTREQGFQGCAEYETIRQVKQAVSIPVVANGDIDSAAKARQVLDQTGCDAVMVGRAALGRPWLFAQIATELTGQPAMADPSLDDVREAMFDHFEDHINFYGEASGVRSIRKHVAWYLPQWASLSGLQQVNGLLVKDWTEQTLQRFFVIDRPESQRVFLAQCFDLLLQNQWLAAA